MSPARWALIGGTAAAGGVALALGEVASRREQDAPGYLNAAASIALAVAIVGATVIAALAVGEAYYGGPPRV